jgi:YD repeat-containing protein
MSRLARIFTGLLCGFAAAGALLRAQAPITYVYDEIGRLVGVVDASGDAASYVYDETGNLLSISRHSNGTVSIIEFTPNSGPIGATVSIAGIGFSPTPANNSVTFNGVSATVSAATATRLTVTVPASATTGTIAVTSPAGNASSATAFTVVSVAAPTITSLSHSIAIIGTALTVTGTNFDTLLPNNRVKVNLTPTYALSGSTSTSLSTTVPVATTSGRVKIETPLGTAVSSADLFIPPDA